MAIRPAAIVVGGGPAGLTAAIALAGGGIDDSTRRQAPGAGRQPHHRPPRRLGHRAGDAWASGKLCAAQAAPLKVMRIVDDTGRLWRAPEVKFACDEIGLEAFGYNIENRHLVAALEQRAHALANLRLIENEVAASRRATTRSP